MRSLNRVAFGYGYRRSGSGGSGCRGRCRDDARCDAEIRGTLDRRTPVRLACFAVSNRAQWHDTRIRVGAWRDESAGPMQVVSGPFGKEEVHYQAPDARRLDREMKLFLEWFSAEQKIDPVLKSGIAHLWFVVDPPV